MAIRSTKQRTKRAPRTAGTGRSRGRNVCDWSELSDEQLLDCRICDLNLSLEGTMVESCLNRLYDELESRELPIRPHCWLSDDWFSPDGIPGIAVPFYMAHPRLMRLERKKMLEVEGGTRSWCMRILRHEAGHAIDTAYRLHRRKKYREIFGRYSEPYPETYKPKPQSKSYVLHLEPWYAQAHPAEDFAETFAVWLKPRSRWRSEYAGWKALKKIEFVDELMEGLRGIKPKVHSRAKVDPVHRIRHTLREHYAERHQRYGIGCPTSFDHDLNRLFSPPGSGRRKAASFLQKNRSELSRLVSQWTGEYRYNINQVLREMIDRCRELELVAQGNEAELIQHAAVMLTVHTMQHLNGGHQRVAL